MAHGEIRFLQKPVSVEGCNANWIAEYLSVTLIPEVSPKPPDPVFVLYRLSYMYYTALGTITTLIVGITVSLLTGSNKDKELNIDLFSPLIHCLIRKKQKPPEVVVISDNKEKIVLQFVK